MKTLLWLSLYLHYLISECRVSHYFTFNCSRASALSQSGQTNYINYRQEEQGEQEEQEEQGEQGEQEEQGEQKSAMRFPHRTPLSSLYLC